MVVNKVVKILSQLILVIPKNGMKDFPEIIDFVSVQHLTGWEAAVGEMRWKDLDVKIGVILVADSNIF
jgi:hypothetical protein